MELDEAAGRFADAIEMNAATVLVGAGLSQGAGYPGWTELLKPFFAEFEVPPDFNLPLLAQYVVDADSSRERLIRHVVAEINAVTATPTVDQRLIVELPIPEIWTTNYDQMLERCAADLVATEVDDDFVTPTPVGRRRVHKMHGSIRVGDADPVGGLDALVLTRDDYDRYEQRHPRAWQLLRAQFLTKSFLFVGFSMSDPNFDAVFRLVRLATPDRYVDHYAVLKPDAAVSGRAFEARCRDLERSGVHVVTISDFSEITTFLQRLVASTRPSRLYVSGSYPRTGDERGGVDGEPYPTGAAQPELREIAASLGAQLAGHGVQVAAGGVLGAEVGYALADSLGAAYHPDALWLLRRRNDRELSPPNKRVGKIVFIGSDPGELRDEIFNNIRALVVLAGQSGSANEVERARAKGMGVVPLALTGGTARAVWEEMSGDLGSYRLGGRPIDADTFALLADADVARATAAAVKLILQALFVPTKAATAPE